MYLVYLCLSLSLDLFVSYPCDQFFIIIFIFIIINHMISLQETHLFGFVFGNFLEYLFSFQSKFHP